MKISKVNIIGVGNVGKQLISQLSLKNVVKNVFIRNPKKIEEFNATISLPVFTDIHLLPHDVDLNIVCVKDDAIKEVIAKLPKNIPIVHTSGSTDLEVFKDFDNYGILYPLQTFSFNHPINLSEVYFLIEANSALFKNEIINFCQSNFSKNIFESDSESRAQIHLAAVFANNFSNNLLASSQKILAEKNIDFKILEPLIIETIRKAFSIGPIEAQTGPAVRGDNKIIEKQLNLLKDENLKEIYKLISKNIQRYSSKV